MRSRRGFFAPFSVSELFLFSASCACWACSLAAFSLRISSRVFTLTPSTFMALWQGPAELHSPWLLPEAFSTVCLAFLGLGLCSCCSSCLFFLAWRISENVLMWVIEWSLLVIARFTPLAVLVLLISWAPTEGPSLDWDFAAFSCLISSRVLMRICSGAFFGSALVSAVVKIQGQ